MTHKVFDLKESNERSINKNNKKIQEIIVVLDDLKHKAELCGNREAASMIDNVFDVCLSVLRLINSYELNSRSVEREKGRSEEPL